MERGATECNINGDRSMAGAAGGFVLERSQAGQGQVDKLDVS